MDPVVILGVFFLAQAVMQIMSLGGFWMILRHVVRG